VEVKWSEREAAENKNVWYSSLLTYLQGVKFKHRKNLHQNQPLALSPVTI
jgi:hypothetical protein